MLVLEGEQGICKDERRARTVRPQYAEAMESPVSKDFYQSPARALVRRDRRDGFLRRPTTKVKQRLPRASIPYRASYGRISRAATGVSAYSSALRTRKRKYLSADATGGRRFLPVRGSGAVAIEAVREIRDQLWAEAVQMFHDGIRATGGCRRPAGGALPGGQLGGGHTPMAGRKGARISTYPERLNPTCGWGPSNG